MLSVSLNKTFPSFFPFSLKVYQLTKGFDDLEEFVENVESSVVLPLVVEHNASVVEYHSMVHILTAVQT